MLRVTHIGYLGRRSRRDRSRNATLCCKVERRSLDTLLARPTGLILCPCVSSTVVDTCSWSRFLSLAFKIIAEERILDVIDIILSCRLRSYIIGVPEFFCIAPSTMLPGSFDEIQLRFRTLLLNAFVGSECAKAILFVKESAYDHYSRLHVMQMAFGNGMINPILIPIGMFAYDAQIRETITIGFAHVTIGCNVHVIAVKILVEEFRELQCGIVQILPHTLVIADIFEKWQETQHFSLHKGTVMMHVIAMIPVSRRRLWGHCLEGRMTR